MAIRAESCSIPGTFYFRAGCVIALAGTRDLLAIRMTSGSFSKKTFWTFGEHTSILKFQRTGRALLTCRLDSLQHGFLDPVFIKFHSNLVDF